MNKTGITSDTSDNGNDIFNSLISETKKSKSRSKRTTRKKLKILGTQEYINKSTGEVEEFEVCKIEGRDFNFHKLWLHHILDTIDLIGNKKVKLAFWIIENLNRDNQLIATQRKIRKGFNDSRIREEDKISMETVSATMRELMEADFLRKISGGVYAVNPNVLFKGGKEDRLNVLLKYRAIASEQDYKKEQKDLAERIKKNGESMQEPMQNNEEEDSEEEDTANNET